MVTNHHAEWLCLDIETTAGRPESAEEYVRRQWWPEERWTPDTIGKRFKEAIEKKREKLGLLDAAGIAVIAMKTATQTMLLHCMKVEPAQSEDYGLTFGMATEREMLMQFRAMLAAGCGDQTVITGWNIRSFDLPRLRMAFLRAGLQMPPQLSGSQPHFDSMVEFCRAFSVERAVMMALSEALDKVGIANHKELVDGSQIDELIAKGAHETILRYAGLDVAAEAELYLRMTGRSGALV